ncbi:quinol oxidase [Crenobacter sp. SG2305]|uniref:quinol oxidase n=1 Tax=Crenobacter oryzisoli TaxID=3056844 RepID=UPI0025AA5C12|nr:quinol oxidase [Crenobacter sp. SG2305]MDN0081723.1 quinol oxidase [Crenobacter sp. SG2305]
MRTAILALLAAVLAAASLFASGEEALYRATTDADGVQRIAIVGGNYFFKPNRIIARVNVPVELSVRVEPGMIPHAFVLETPQGDKVTELKLGGKAQTVTFTPKRVGRYLFYCPNKLLFFKSHREEGMSGYLDVEE